MKNHIGDNLEPPPMPSGGDYSLDACLRRQVISAWRAAHMAAMSDEDAAFFRGKAYGIEQARGAASMVTERLHRDLLVKLGGTQV